MGDKKIYTVGITGASGVIYGVRVVEELLKLDNTVNLVITEAGWQGTTIILSILTEPLAIGALKSFIL